MISTCTKEFTIPEVASGIDWSTINWTLIDFFESPPDSHSAGTVSGNSIACQCDGTPATSSGGLNVIGELTYTGPLVNCKVTISGIPVPSTELMALDLRISHATAGMLLQVLYANLVSDPQVFNFVVPASSGDLITITGDGSTLLYTQNAPGAVNALIVIENQ